MDQNTWEYRKSWRHRLQLRDLVIKDDSFVAAKTAAGGIFARLEPFRKQYYPADLELTEICLEFEAIADPYNNSGAMADALATALTALYDWAETDKRLWIE